jgi:hypothetical protein
MILPYLIMMPLMISLSIGRKATAYLLPKENAAVLDCPVTLSDFGHITLNLIGDPFEKPCL